MSAGDNGHMDAARQLLLNFSKPGHTGDAKARAAAQRSPAGWPVSRDDLAQQIRQRLHGALPAQLTTSYCGPAAFLYCLIKDRPDIYTAYAISLWEQGHFFFGNARAKITIDSGHGVVPAAVALVKAHPGAARRGYISDLDWMTMSCLSASTRPFNFGTVTPDDQLGSITFPWVLRRWFIAAGAVIRADTMGFGAFKSGLLDTLSLMSYSSSSWIVLQIDSSLLRDGDPDFFHKRHWVVVDPTRQPIACKQPGNTAMPLGAVADEVGKIVWQRVGKHAGEADPDESDVLDALKGTPVADWTTTLTVASWANEHHTIYTGKVGRLIDRVYGGYVFSRFK